MVCLLALFVVAGASLSCLAATASAKRGEPPSAPLRPAPATAAFGLDLLRAHGPGNVVLSPDSIAAALAMTGTGANGRTSTEIAHVLHLKGPAAFRAVGTLQDALAREQATAALGATEPPKLEIANGLFVQGGLPLSPAFLAGTQEHFGAVPESVDFAGDPTGALETINGWVSDHTEGLIPAILESLPGEMALALANAVYLHADWAHPFEKHDTKPGLFHTAGETAQVEFMHKAESVRYGTGPGYEAVELPYDSSTLSLMIVLPAGQRVGSLQNHLDAGVLTRMARGLAPTPVSLSLPRFHLDTEAALKSTLEKLGMPTAFSEAADFSRITSAAPLKISFVQHDADFTVDEDGTVAAAATVGGLVTRSKEVRPRHAVTFNANRPFLFFLRDDTTGAVLFAGRLADPTASS